MSRCTFFFSSETATPEIYTLSLHDALPICLCQGFQALGSVGGAVAKQRQQTRARIGVGSSLATAPPTEPRDRKSTRLNSSHSQISYAVFCLKKKNIQKPRPILTRTRRALLD